MERRASNRHKCRLGCELWVNGRSIAATVVDFSRGGLGIQVGVSIEQGESLRVSFAPGGKPVEVEALVWHVRRVRRGEVAAASFLLGTVLCEPPAEYLEMADRLAPKGRPLASPSPDDTAHGRARSTAQGPTRRHPPANAIPALKVEAQAATPQAAEPAAARTFRVRTRTACNRTKLLYVDALSAEEAKAKALSALGPDWAVLEIEADRGGRRG